MEREEMQKKGGHSAHWIPCACALFLSLLLFTCFTANVFVTHHNFLRCERSVFMFPGYHKKVTCTREDPGPPNPGGSWHCCPEGWEGLRPSCLRPFGDNRTWVDSDRNCSALGARLASLPTRDQLVRGGISGTWRRGGAGFQERL
ncbi:C-type lectin domain family 4 member D [Thomomys bottae]